MTKNRSMGLDNTSNWYQNMGVSRSQLNDKIWKYTNESVIGEIKYLRKGELKKVKPRKGGTISQNEG